MNIFSLISRPKVPEANDRKKLNSCCKIQIALCESTAEEVAYEWPYHRILSTDSIVATSVELPSTATY